jgi:hypothetical protein
VPAILGRRPWRPQDLLTTAPGNTRLTGAQSARVRRCRSGLTVAKALGHHVTRAAPCPSASPRTAPRERLLAQPRGSRCTGCGRRGIAAPRPGVFLRRGAVPISRSDVTRRARTRHSKPLQEEERTSFVTNVARSRDGARLRVARRSAYGDESVFPPIPAPADAGNPEHVRPTDLVLVPGAAVRVGRPSPSAGSGATGGLSRALR